MRSSNCDGVSKRRVGRRPTQESFDFFARELHFTYGSCGSVEFHESIVVVESLDDIHMGGPLSNVLALPDDLPIVVFGERVGLDKCPVIRQGFERKETHATFGTDFDEQVSPRTEIQGSPQRRWTANVFKIAQFLKTKLTQYGMMISMKP